MRGCLAIAGMAVCLIAWLAPQQLPIAQPFTQHMLRHILLIAVAAPFLAAAMTAQGKRHDVSPLLATALEFLVVWAWHLPTLHEWAAVSTFGFIAEQASFLLAGLLLWASVLQPGRALAGAGGLLITSMHMTFLGAILIFSPRVLYAAVCFGPEPLADQRVGGMLMLAIGTPIYLVAGLFLVARELNAPAAGRPEVS